MSSAVLRCVTCCAVAVLVATPARAAGGRPTLDCGSGPAAAQRHAARADRARDCRHAVRSCGAQPACRRGSVQPPAVRRDRAFG